RARQSRAPAPRGTAVRAMLLGLALALGLSAHAEDKAQDKPQRKKPAKQAAHKKASPEQIRKFNELEKKQQK
ncbi:MAG TPA: hypothetical protein VNH80_10870, partial [Burkholderiales bacterium]|nr:hypothetical protein [Burkholderiales bacterium]